MLATRTIDHLRQLGVQATTVAEFKSGLKLMQLVNQVFYHGQNHILSGKLRVVNQERTGNNVLNINMILNHLKKDPSIHLQESIKQLNSFSLLEEEATMLLLIQWILSKHQGMEQIQSPSQLSQNMSPPRQQDNQFQNLYFVASLEKKPTPVDDSLEEEDNPQERVVRKGSFKVFKPKLHTAGKILSEESENREGGYRSEKKEDNKGYKEPLRQIVLVEPNQSQQRQEKDDLQNRKTIPKLYERPPLCRPKTKEQRQTQHNSFKKDAPPTPESTTRLDNNQQLFKNIESINKQIIQEERSFSQIQLSTKPEKRARKSSQRKVFKLDMPEVNQKKKKVLLEWLISINLLSSSSIKFISQLHEICKDGVVFVEVINYYKGRGREISYFKEPKRSAELHSNYQKLFTTLNQLADFNSELLHQYDYFIPEAQPNAFWNLLTNIHQCFNKRVQPREPCINRYQNQISRKVDRQLSKRKHTNESTSYKEIKYNSSSVKKEFNSNCSSVELIRKEGKEGKEGKESKEVKQTAQTPKRGTSRHSEQELSIAPYGLVQNEEPVDLEANRTERGYKEIYLCKFKNIETPYKNRSFQNSSLSKSRLKQSMNSSLRKESKPLQPSISLEMQMKVMSYLQQFSIEEDVQELFKDPYRNGLLLCLAVRQHLGIQCCGSRKPRSIQDCRNNFYGAMEIIKSHKQQFNTAYQSCIEELLKGEKSLLYGLIWSLIREDEREGNNRINRISTGSFTLNADNSQNEEATIFWIRSVEKEYPLIGKFKIRDCAGLYSAITGTDFLFHYSWLMTGRKAVNATYQRPINDVQKESNLKKILGYLIQNKMIRSDYLWKTRALVKNQHNLMKDLVADLVSHYSHLHKKEQIRTVNFVKYVKREDSESRESREKYQDKLETTMANQTLVQQPTQVQLPRLEITWLRKLGFSGSLELNNGVILGRLVSKMTMKTIEGFNDRPQSRAECLGNLRRAIKLISKFRWDEYDILNCDRPRTLEVYSFLKDKYKHAYAMKGI